MVFAPVSDGRELRVRGFFDSLPLAQNDRIRGLCVHGCVYSFSKQKPLGIDFLKKNDTERAGNARG